MSLILIADDDANLRYSIQRMLAKTGHSFVEAEDGEAAVAAVREHHPDVVLMDVRMPRLDGLAAFEQIKRVAPRVPVIIITAYGTTEIAIETMKRGAYDYILKPFDVEEMCSVVARAIKAVEQQGETTALPRDEETHRPHQLVGSSRAMQRVYKAIGQVAASNAHVLLQGDSGTGKELVARAIHSYSERADKPFMAINCAAIPENLIESELFGHEKGAFTGAVDRKTGLLQVCHGGTVLLDEIAELPLPAQAKLLRFLQEGDIIRLGGHAPICLDVRVVAATNTDLQKAVQEKRFREDLLFRLNMMSISVPPLRKHLEDLEELVAHFVNIYNKQHGKSFSRVSSDVITLLRQRSWPGNVRELENLIRKAVIVGRGDVLLREHLFPDTFVDAGGDRQSPTVARSLEGFIDQLVEHFNEEGQPPLIPTMERLLIARVLELCQGNQVKAAKMLGISRNTLRNRIERFGVELSVKVDPGG